MTDVIFFPDETSLNESKRGYMHALPNVNIYKYKIVPVLLLLVGSFSHIKGVKKVCSGF